MLFHSMEQFCVVQTKLLSDEIKGADLVHATWQVVSRWQNETKAGLKVKTLQHTQHKGWALSISFLYKPPTLPHTSMDTATVY